MDLDDEAKNLISHNAGDSHDRELQMFPRIGSQSNEVSGNFLPHLPDDHVGARPKRSMSKCCFVLPYTLRKARRNGDP